jgi:hypothetical protein
MIRRWFYRKLVNLAVNLRVRAQPDSPIIIWAYILLKRWLMQARDADEFKGWRRT